MPWGDFGDSGPSTGSGPHGGGGHGVGAGIGGPSTGGGLGGYGGGTGNRGGYGGNNQGNFGGNGGGGGGYGGGGFGGGNFGFGSGLGGGDSGVGLDPNRLDKNYEFDPEKATTIGTTAPVGPRTSRGALFGDLLGLAAFAEEADPSLGGLGGTGLGTPANTPSKFGYGIDADYNLSKALDRAPTNNPNRVGSVSSAVDALGRGSGLSFDGQYGQYDSISPNTVSGLGNVTEAELGDLGVSLGLSAGRARALGLTVDTAKRTVSPSSFDLSRAVGKAFNESYTTSLETFDSIENRALGSVAAGLEEGTIQTTETGFKRSPIGRLGEVGSFAKEAYSFTQAAPAGVAALSALSLPAAAPVAALAYSAYSLYSAFDKLSQLSELDKTLERAGLLDELDRPARTPTTGPDSGGSGFGTDFAPFYGDAEIPTATAGTPPVAPTPTGTPPKRLNRGLESTVRTGFFGAGIPTVRRVR